MFKRYVVLSRVEQAVEVDTPDYQNRLLVCATILQGYENKQQLFPSTASTDWLFLRYV